jgi:arylsulfatase A-like enzyme
MSHCFGLLAPLLVALASLACSQPQRPNVLLVVVDTLRKDHLHLYGHPQPLSPVIDALAAQGWAFENHFTHATQTVPATLSLLLSRLPADHGFSPPDPKIFARERPFYPAGFLFLAEVLRDAGFTTAGFTANPYLTRDNGFDQGHATFASLPGPGEAINAAAIQWLGAWGKERSKPFYLYLHYMDVHQPYLPPERFRERFVSARGGVMLDGSRPIALADPRDLAYSNSVYVATVAHVDDLIGEILRELDALGVRDSTIIVVTADHGEEFGEHGGIGHGRTLYGELVRVPLVIAYPPKLEPGRRIAHLSQHIDVAPTILRLARIEKPSAFQGNSVLEPVDRIFLEIGPWRGVVTNDGKEVWNRSSGEQKVFALGDELDRTPLDDPALAASLRVQLEPYLALEARRDPALEAKRVGASWSKEETERLRALGYVQ